MSQRRLSRTLLLGLAVATAVAGPAQAEVTSTPLGTCAKADPTKPGVVSNLRVSNPTTVEPNGTPRGQVGLTVRSTAQGGEGAVLELGFTVIDLTTGKTVGNLYQPISGCARYLVPLKDFRLGAPMKLSRQRLYAIRGAASWSDTRPVDGVLGTLVNLGYALQAPIALFYVR